MIDLGPLVLREPWWLAALLLAPWIVARSHRAHGGALPFAPAPLLDERPGASGELPPVPASRRQRLVRLPALLLAAGLACGVVALARPVEVVVETVATEGLDIVLCIDRSSSMTAADMGGAATRLDVVRAAATRFVSDRAGDRIGLLGFARYPDVLCPPTRDHEVLAAQLDALEPVAPDGPEDATGIGGAVGAAVVRLAAREDGDDVVVLLTDGEENVASAARPGAIAPVHAAQLARREGVRVYTVAVGRGRRGTDGRWRPLDTGQVEALAEATGGAFFVARDAGDVAAVYAAIDALETTEEPEPRRRLEDRRAAWLVAALLAVVVGRLLGETALAVLPEDLA